MLIDIFSKIKSYGLLVLGALAGIFYLLFKSQKTKNEILTRENSDLHAANEEMQKASKEKAKDEKALREATKAINGIEPNYKYSSDK